MVRNGVAVLALAVGFSGCFSYIPAEFHSVPAGDHVRVLVTPSVVEQMEDITIVRGRLLRGVVTSKDEQQLFLRVPIVTRQEGFHSAELGQDVRIPAVDIIQMERREFDRLGTGALVAGTIGTAAAIVFYIMKAFGEEEEPGEPCPDCNGDPARVPIFSIPR